MKHTILVVDDEPGQRQFVGGSLSKEYEIVAAANGREASQLLSHRSVSLVITDERMPDMGGIDLVRWMRDKSPETPVIVLTAYGSVATAVEAIKIGAEEYLTKPLKSPEELRLVVAKVLSAVHARPQPAAPGGNRGGFPVRCHCGKRKHETNLPAGRPGRPTADARSF